MSYPSTPLQLASVQQLATLTKARYDFGAHAFYTAGHRTDEKNLHFQFAGTFEDGCRLTIAFQYVGPLGTNKYSIYYGLYNKHMQTYVRIDFSAQYGFEYRYDDKPVATSVNLAKTAMQGLHVVEYRRKANTMEVYMDGTLLYPGDTFHDQPRWMRVFYTNAPGLAPFIFWESHCNMSNPLVAMRGMGLFTFNHENVSVRLGGYALYVAEWPENTPIHLHISGRAIANAVANAGVTACLLKVYRLGYLFANAKHRGNVQLNTHWPWVQAPELPLGPLHVLPLPMRVVELRIVTGPFSK